MTSKITLVEVLIGLTLTAVAGRVIFGGSNSKDKSREIEQENRIEGTVTKEGFANGKYWFVVNGYNLDGDQVVRDYFFNSAQALPWLNTLDPKINKGDKVGIKVPKQEGSAFRLINRDVYSIYR